MLPCAETAAMLFWRCSPCWSPPAMAIRILTGLYLEHSRSPQGRLYRWWLSHRLRIGISPRRRFLRLVGLRSSAQRR